MRSYFCNCFEDQKYGHRGFFNVYIKQNQKVNQWEERRFFSLIPPCIFALLYCKLYRLAFKCTMSKAKHLPSTYVKRCWQGAERKILPNTFNAKLPTAHTTSPVSHITIFALWTKKKSPEEHFSSNRATATFHL